MKLMNKAYNWYLSTRYQLFPPAKVKFSGEKTTYDLSKAKLYAGSIYNFAGHNSTLSESCVSIIGDNINLYTMPFNEVVNNGWQTPEVCDHKIGWVSFDGVYPKSYGTWEVKFSYSKGSLPAVWMLRERYPDIKTSQKIPIKTWDNRLIFLKEKVENIDYNWCIMTSDWRFLGYVKSFNDETIILDRDNPFILKEDFVFLSKDNIIPEVDLFEIIDNKYAQTVHYGLTPSNKKYALDSFTHNVCEAKAANYDITVAVTITPKKYIFYIDGIKTSEIWAGCSDKPVYLILNVTSYGEYINQVNKMTVKEINYYE